MLSVKSSYDLILMDFVMPNMDGPTATKSIRELGYHGSIVGLTGNGLDSDISYFKEHGVEEVFVKPLDFAALMSYMKTKK